MEETSTIPSNHSSTHLPLLGFPDNFLLIHLTAIISLVISIIVSAAVVTYLIRRGVSISRKTIGERLTIYLAICDLCYSISHLLDHSYMTAAYDHPPDNICVPFSYFLSVFILAQSLLVSFTAINAFLLVVKEVKLSLGKYDWRLLVGAFGFPALGMVPCAALGLIGPSGAWCFVDMRKPSGTLLTNIFSCAFVFTFLANLICYMLVWTKIKQVTRATASIGSSTSRQVRYAGTARILSLFVAAYIAQWWPYVAYSVWEIFNTAHISMLVVVVLLCNMGGVFNSVAYTFVRLLLRRSGTRYEGNSTTCLQNEQGSRVIGEVSFTTVTSGIAPNGINFQTR